MADLHTMTRQELQSLAKAHGVRANQKTIELITQLEKILKQATAENEPNGTNVLHKGMESLTLDDPSATDKKKKTKQQQESKEKLQPDKKSEESPLMTLMRRMSTSSTSSPLSSPSLTKSRIPNRRSTIGPSELWTPQHGDNVENLAEKRRNSLIPNDIVEERVRIAVNAIRALRGGEKGCTFDQICDFIKLHPAGLYDPGKTAVQLHRALRVAVEKQAVIGKEGANREIRFSVPNTRFTDNPHTPTAVESPTSDDDVEVKLSPTIDASEETGKTKRKPSRSEETNRRVTISGTEYRTKYVPKFSSGLRSFHPVPKPSQESFKAKVLQAVKEERLRRNRFRAEWLKDVSPKLNSARELMDELKPTLQPTYICHMCSVKDEGSGNREGREREDGSYSSRVGGGGEFSTPMLSRVKRPAMSETPQVTKPNEGSIVEVQQSVEIQDNWIVRESRSKPGKFYYYNTVTKEATWNLNTGIED